MTLDALTEYGGQRGDQLVAEIADKKQAIPLSMSVEGLEGTGKSSFVLNTCPLPIVHINYGDRSAAPLLMDMSEERRSQITLYNFQAESPFGWTRAECRKSLDALSKIAQHHLSDGSLQGGTFCIDSGSTWWSSVQEVYVAPEMEKREADGKKKTGGLEYSQANLLVNGALSWIKRQGVFLIITHQKRQEWGSSGPIPGQYKPRMNSGVPSLVEVRLDLQKLCMVCKTDNQTCESSNNHVGRKHVGRIAKFGRNTKLEGTVLENVTFGLIYLLYMGTPFPDEERIKP